MTQASGGPADWYIEKVTQALAITDAKADLGRVATLHAALSQAYGWAGLLEEALAANDVVLAHAHKVEASDHAFVGFNVEHWALGMRGRLLTRLGRFDEARVHLARLLDFGDAVIDPVVRQMTHYAFVDLAWCNNDPALAHTHSAVLAEIAGKHNNPYQMVFATSSRALTLSIAGDFEAAATTFTEALETIRGSNVSLELESEVLANLAECHRRLGNLELALMLAREATDVSRQRSTRLAECRALISHAAILIDGRSADKLDEARSLLEAADALIGVTGATIYRSALRAEQHRLQEWAGQPEESLAP
jgi:tetratricopeptide (TPR) repeat protein